MASNVVYRRPLTRARALEYATEIARRLHQFNGIIGTPNCVHEAVVVRRVWVFGSFAKGSMNPNDLDVLIDCVPAGRRQTWKPGRKIGGYILGSLPVMRTAENEFLKWLTQGMRQVSRHLYQTEKDGEIILNPKVLIYPRWELSEVETWQRAS